VKDSIVTKKFPSDENKKIFLRKEFVRAISV